MSLGIAGQLSLYDLLGSPPPEPVTQVSPLDEIEADIDVDVDHSADDAPIAGAKAWPSSGSEAASGSDSPAGVDSSGDSLQLPPLEVEVTRSRRRKKTAEARLVGTVLSVRIPAASSADEERYFVDHFRDKFERSRVAGLLDLERRAKALATAYGLPTPQSIRWVSNQKSQWGSCTPADRTIRLSDRMAGFPRWVIDYVIVHELAHLVEGDHGPAFWALVDAYPKTERARGYLMAKDGV